jgi:hypothetical protein
MTRVQYYGRWRVRAVRAITYIRSLAAFIALWRRMSRHDKMWVLWAAETTPAGSKNALAAAIARRIRSAYVEVNSRPEADRQH